MTSHEKEVWLLGLDTFVAKRAKDIYMQIKAAEDRSAIAFNIAHNHIGDAHLKAVGEAIGHLEQVKILTQELMDAKKRIKDIEEGKE